MTDTRRKWDILTKEKRAVCVKAVISYYKTERNEDIGIIAAEEILDFFLQLFGDDIHNKAIEESRSWLKSRLEDLEVDFDELLK